MAVDGYLNFNTKIDTSGVEKGTDKITAEVKETASDISKVASQTSEKIQAILNDTEKSHKSKAASIAAIYRSQGMNMSEAMEQAWSHIERNSASTNKKIRSDFKLSKSQITSGISSVKSIFSKLAITAGVAFSVRGIVNFAKSSIELASNLEEVQNVVDVAFGDMSGKMEEFADKAIEMYGISELAAKKTGSTFMAMAKGMQIPTDVASDMSIALTGLSADMASFHNEEQSVTETALHSVFTGETETLKKFGIVMTEANLQQFAYTQGINKKISAMSQAEKVLLRYNYVMNQTALAQGDFARTSGNWANQTRVLSMQWQQFSANLGVIFKNVIKPALAYINQALSVLIAASERLINTFSELFGWETESADATGQVSSSIADAVGNQEDLTQAVKDTAKANERALMGFDKINKLSDNSSDSSSGGSSVPAGNYSDTDTSEKEAEEKISLLREKFMQSLYEVKSWWNNNFSDIFSGIWNGISAEAGEFSVIIADAFSDLGSLKDELSQYFTSDFTTLLQAAFGTAGSTITGLFDTFNTVFSDIWNLAVFPLIEGLTANFLPFITQLCTDVVETFGVLFDGVKSVFDLLWTEGISPVLTVISTIITDVLASIKQAWDKWGKPIFDNLKDAIENTVNTVQAFWEDCLQPIWDSVIEAAKEIWNDYLKPFLNNVLDLIGELTNGALEIYNKFISPIVTWFVQKFGPPIAEIFKTLVERVKNSITSVISTVNGIVTLLKGVIQFVVGVFTGDWKKAWNGIKTALKGVLDTFKGLFKTAWNGIKAVFNIDIVSKFFKNVWGSIKSAFGNIPDWFKDKFKSAWKKVKDVFSKGGETFEGIKDGILSSLKSIINGLIDGINAVIKAPFDGINTALKKVKDIKIAGATPFKDKIKLINVPEIPKLATGTVVPANYGEFLAVLGDNKRETEVVSPLSTIKRAVAEVIGDGINSPIELIVYLDGDVVYRKVVQKNNQETKRRGVNPLAV